MGLKVNTIISLANAEQYVILSEALYNEKKYFLVMGVNADKDVIPNKVAIIEELVEGEETYINKVTDPDLIVVLTRLLKNQL